jgi:chemotaxis protein CheD
VQRVTGLPSGVERRHLVAVHQGECTVSDDASLMLSAVLGSCISACVRDRVARVGGMNHFLLAAPGGQAPDRFGAPARYGAYAMELLINRVLSAGTGRKANLEIKVFGGGIVSRALTDVGARNIGFVRRFLAEEGYAIASEDMGGGFARRVLFQPASGRALVRRLTAARAAAIARSELQIARLVPTRDAAGPDVELF